MAARFNQQFARAVRHEPQQAEAAKKFVAMHHSGTEKP